MAGTKNDNRKAKHKANAQRMSDRGIVRAANSGLSGFPVMETIGSAAYRRLVASDRRHHG